jgi:hypothetical protein
MKVLKTDYHIEGKKGKDWVPFGGTHTILKVKATKQFAALKKHNPRMKFRLIEEKTTVVQ